MSNLLRNTDHKIVDNNAISIIQIYESQIYESNSLALNDCEDLIEYDAESSDYEEDCPISKRRVVSTTPPLGLTSDGFIQNDDVPIDHQCANNNAISIIHIYGTDSVAFNDCEDLIEYDAESSDNDAVEDQILDVCANTNEIGSPSSYRSDGENNRDERIQLIFGEKVFTFIDDEDLVSYSESSDDDEVEPLDTNDAAAHLDSITDEIETNDDEYEDFSDAPTVYKGRPKRGRKRKIPGQSRADRKRLYNTNKRHFNTKGNIVDERRFDENFVCRCSRKCTDVVSVEKRKRLFNQFWSIGSFAGRCAMLLVCVLERSKKRSYAKIPMRNRAVSRQFTMFGHLVCKVAVLRTLQINHKRIDLALYKQKFSDSLVDCRGKAGGINAFPVSKRVEVQAHISSFPKYISHYTRSQTESKFLSSCLNLAKMYSLYRLEAESPVSKSFYKRVFYDDFNLRFKKPKKDTCLKCDLYAVKIKNPLLSEADRTILVEWHRDHLTIAESLRAQMNEDLEMAKTDNTLEALAFDFQKILSVPRLTTSIVYYKRQLNMYNFGIHVGSTGRGIFNVWPETVASKGTQEVGSCLKKHISTIDGPEKLILWSDACGGQNRSIKLILMLIHMLQNHKTLETISIRYLQSGHSFLPNDSEFGDFECALKKAGPLFTDAEFIEIMENCRVKNKFIVQRMSSRDFFSVKYLEREITNRKSDSNKRKVSWLDTHEIVIEKSQPSIIKMRKTIDGPFQEVNIEKRNSDMTSFGNIELDELWPEGRPLSKEKVADLNEILKLVPEEHKPFYSFLNTALVGDFTDDIDGFGEHIDFTIEYDEC